MMRERDQYDQREYKVFLFYFGNNKISTAEMQTFLQYLLYFIIIMIFY